MSALERRYDGRAHIVRINVDSAEARAALQKYRVRATPTFVLFDRHGKILWNTAGWMGEAQVVQAFDALIAQP